MKKYIKISIFFIIFISKAYAWQQEMVLDLEKTFKLYWTVDVKKNVWLFEIQAKAMGLIGFGIAPDQSFTRADVVVAYIDPDGNPHATDYWTTDEGHLEHEPSHDWKIINARKNESFSMFRIRRSLKPNDRYDAVIYDRPTWIIWTMQDFTRNKRPSMEKVLWGVTSQTERNVTEPTTQATRFNATEILTGNVTTENNLNISFTTEETTSSRDETNSTDDTESTTISVKTTVPTNDTGIPILTTEDLGSTSAAGKNPTIISTGETNTTSPSTNVTGSTTATGSTTLSSTVSNNNISESITVSTNETGSTTPSTSAMISTSTSIDENQSTTESKDMARSTTSFSTEIQSTTLFTDSVESTEIAMENTSRKTTTEDPLMVGTVPEIEIEFQEDFKIVKTNYLTQVTFPAAIAFLGVLLIFMFCTAGKHSLLCRICEANTEQTSGLSKSSYP